MGNLCTTMKTLCCCGDKRRTASHVSNEMPRQNAEQTAAVISIHLNQPSPVPGSINPMYTRYNIHSEEVGTAVQNEIMVQVVKSNTPTEHSLGTLSNVSDVDGPTHPVSS